MRFTDAYAAAPVCTPTRTAMMTGISPARLAITNHAPGNPDFVSQKTRLKGTEWTTYLALDHVTIAERLKQADYATGFIGEWLVVVLAEDGWRRPYPLYRVGVVDLTVNCSVRQMLFHRCFLSKSTGLPV